MKRVREALIGLSFAASSLTVTVTGCATEDAIQIQTDDETEYVTEYARDISFSEAPAANGAGDISDGLRAVALIGAIGTMGALMCYMWRSGETLPHDEDGAYDSSI